MFSVKTPEEVFEILASAFPQKTETEMIPLPECSGRVLAEDISASEYVPGFRRSAMDGYALHASDTFGCSDSIPALLVLDREVRMGEEAGAALPPGHCVYVPTGGAIPDGADAVVMIEYTEDFGDGTIGISKAAAPGTNIILKGDDVYPGKLVLKAGRKLTAADLGALAAMGVALVPVRKKPLAGIISTGDELVPVTETPGNGQVRDVNGLMLSAVCREAGADTVLFGIVKDELEPLKQAVRQALDECDIVLISGGSSVGNRDATAQAIESYGELLVHGIAMKPGKPTILGKAAGKPVFGLPGHPVASYFVSALFVRQLIASFTGRTLQTRTTEARLTEAVSANHGRSECLGVRLITGENEENEVNMKNGRNGQKILYAEPVRTKSGLISALAGADGYIIISRDCEGLPAGAAVDVVFHSAD